MTGKSSYIRDLKVTMEVASKTVTAVHTRVEDLRAKAIHLCPEASAERLLLSRILHDVDTQK